MYLLLFKQTDHTRSLEESDYHEVLQKDDWNLVKCFPRLKMQRKTHSERKDWGVNLCSEGPLLRRSYVPNFSKGPLFRRSYVQRIFKNYLNLGPSEHRTFNPPEGPLFRKECLGNL